MRLLKKGMGVNIQQGQEEGEEVVFYTIGGYGPSERVVGCWRILLGLLFVEVLLYSMMMMMMMMVRTWRTKWNQYNKTCHKQ
jgi:hypothetical protein